MDIVHTANNISYVLQDDVVKVYTRTVCPYYTLYVILYQSFYMLTSLANNALVRSRHAVNDPTRASKEIKKKNTSAL